MGSPPEFLILWAWSGAQEFAFLINSYIMVILLVCTTLWGSLGYRIRSHLGLAKNCVTNLQSPPLCCRFLVGKDYVTIIFASSPWFPGCTYQAVGKCLLDVSERVNCGNSISISFQLYCFSERHSVGCYIRFEFKREFKDTTKNSNFKLCPYTYTFPL